METFSRKKILLWILISSAAIAVGTVLYYGNFHYARKANQILNEAGTDGGLIVHANCGNGKLTAALHASDSYIVQGISGTESSIMPARDFIRKKGLYGKISVVRWQIPMRLKISLALAR